MSGSLREGRAAGRFVVSETTTAADISAAGLPDPLYCERGLAERARYLADLIDAEVGGETSCGGGGIGYVPDIREIVTPRSDPAVPDAREPT